MRYLQQNAALVSEWVFRVLVLLGIGVGLYLRAQFVTQDQFKEVVTKLQESDSLAAKDRGDLTRSIIILGENVKSASDRAKETTDRLEKVIDRLNTKADAAAETAAANWERTHTR